MSTEHAWTVCVCDPSIQERQEGGSEILSSHLHRQFKAGAGCGSVVELLHAKGPVFDTSNSKEEGEERKIKRVGKRGWRDPDQYCVNFCAHYFEGLIQENSMQKSLQVTVVCGVWRGVWLSCSPGCLVSLPLRDKKTDREAI